MENSELDSFYWHDGQLDDIAFSLEAERASIDLKLKVYANHGAAKRNVFKIRFNNVVSWQNSCDTSELFENRFAGEIIDGYFRFCKKERKKGILTFRMHMCDGFIEINSKDIEVIELGSDK